MNKLREEFIECFMWSSKDDCWKLLPRRTPEKIFDWINQNYISKQQILNLECLKEEEETLGGGKWVVKDYDAKAKNQLRKEIIDEIKKLW